MLYYAYSNAIVQFAQYYGKPYLAVINALNFAWYTSMKWFFLNLSKDTPTNFSWMKYA